MQNSVNRRATNISQSSKSLRLGSRSGRAKTVCGFAVALWTASCSNAIETGSGQGSGSGGSGPSHPAATGGSSSLPSGETGTGSGASVSSSGGTGGATTTPISTGGSAVGPGGTGTGGTTIGSTGGKGGATASPGGTPGAGTPVVGPFTAPPAGGASTVPVIRAPSGQYKVEGNYAYGKLIPQRIDVIYPITAGPKGTEILPAVIMFHGGGWIHSYNNDSGKDHMTTFSDRFLAHGFIVFDAEYRVADGSPEAALAPAAVEDALLAAKWAWDYLDYFHGDRSRFVVTGASAGGHLALMVGMGTLDANLGPTNPGDFKIAAIVDGYGIADVQAVLNGLARPWIPATLPNRDAIVKAVNPMTYIRKDMPPLIVVQGSNDNTAPVGDSRRLVAMLKSVGADATMHEVAGAGHGFTTPAGAWDDAEKAMFDWLTARGIGK